MTGCLTHLESFNTKGPCHCSEFKFKSKCSGLKSFHSGFVQEIFKWCFIWSNLFIKNSWLPGFGYFTTKNDQPLDSPCDAFLRQVLCSSQQGDQLAGCEEAWDLSFHVSSKLLSSSRKKWHYLLRSAAKQKTRQQQEISNSINFHQIS